MNKIELILADSTYRVEQFSATQIEALNEMVDGNISIDQVAVIAHPNVNELAYSVLFDYLSKGNTITSQEYQKYLEIDAERVNDIIVNVYLGKLHGLTNEQIDLYARRNIYSIKIARLLLEHSKDQPTEILTKLINGKFGINTIIGRQAVQDYINNDISIDQFLIFSDCTKLEQSTYDFIKKYPDKRALNLLSQCIKTDGGVYNYYSLMQSVNIDDCTQLVSKSFYDAEDQSTFVHFDSMNTYTKFINVYKTFYNYSHSAWEDWEQKVINYYKYEITGNCKFLNIKLDFVPYYIQDNNLHSRGGSGWLLRYYFDADYCINEDLKITYEDEFPEFDDYLDMYEKTKGFKSYVDAKWIKKFDEESFELVKQGYDASAIALFKLYKTKKDKEVEIPYLTEQLKNAEDKQINEVICMKQNKCSNDDIHYFIENYLKAYIKPSQYFEKDTKYNKYWTIKEWLDLNKYYSSVSSVDDVIKLKEAGFSDTDIQFVRENNIILYNQPIQRALLEMFMEFGAKNLGYIRSDIRTITIKQIDADEMLDNYNMAKDIFKNKPRCIGFFIDPRHTEKLALFDNYLNQYVDNFDDETLSKIVNEFTETEIEFILKISPITTDLNLIINILDNIEDNEALLEFIEDDAKVTTNIFIKFCNDAGIKRSIIESVIPETADITIEKTIEYLDSSKNFKPIQYDDETTYIDIIGNKALKGDHIITFNKEDDNYEYIFEIKHENDTLNYSAKIDTKKDVVDAINKSIALIENIDEYKEYAEELREMLKSI